MSRERLEEKVMTSTIKWSLAAILALAVTAGGDEAEDQRHLAAKLEQRAEELLEQGRRAEALELLVRAHEIRAKADKGGATVKKTRKKSTKKKAKGGAKKGKKAAANNRAAAAAALKMADGNLAAGQTEQATRQLRQAMKHLVLWQKHLNMRQKELQQRAVAAKAAPAGERALMERLERLEKEVRALRALMAPKR